MNPATDLIQQNLRKIYKEIVMLQCIFVAFGIYLSVPTALQLVGANAHSHLVDHLIIATLWDLLALSLLLKPIGVQINGSMLTSYYLYGVKHVDLTQLTDIINKDSFLISFILNMRPGGWGPSAMKAGQYSQGYPNRLELITSDSKTQILPTFMAKGAQLDGFINQLQIYNHNQTWALKEHKYGLGIVIAILIIFVIGLGALIYSVVTHGTTR